MSDHRRLIGWGLLLLVSGCVTTAPTNDRTLLGARDATELFIQECLQGDCGFSLDPGTELDTVLVDQSGSIELRFNDAFAQVPFREHDVAGIRRAIEARLPPGTQFQMTALGSSVEELVPNIMRTESRLDASRRPADSPRGRPLVRYPDGAPPPERGLAGRHIALWASHGWYYEPSLDRWEWQRARLFTTVEDLLPTSFVLPYLAPMLERAGAQVWMPRERDTQSQMVIVDNDGGPGYSESCPWESENGGFGGSEPPYGADDRPWSSGTHRWMAASSSGSCSISWKTGLPETGEYAVYVSHGRHDGATDRAQYLVKHAGGTTRVELDQRMAAGTWLYVGTFPFADSAEVVLSNQGQPGVTVSADAVRFGGGMGIVERGGRTSGRPRWLEGARYALQFDGMPAALVYNVTEAPDQDYLDDYRNRGEWVNYLRGAPLGPNKNPGHPGLGVPIDLSLAFHTDAGIAPGDTTIGTLAIYSSRGYGPNGEEARVFNDGLSRFANRDLADAVQTQIVSDLRALYDPDWTRRAIWDRDYSEAYRPNVPSMLLELLSHQNFSDMRFALDPAFRFDASRAIYKAMLRFVASQYGEPEPVVAPLAPIGLRAVRGPDGIRVSWSGREDPLEPSASPVAYRVYQRHGSSGFDNGMTVHALSVVVQPDSMVTSFRVTALNDGGESAVSETVAAGVGQGPRLLVIAGFDRIGPPAALDGDEWRGFPGFMDQGVSDGSDLSYVGGQYELRSSVAWADDDAPGHGASHADWETRLEPGNSFDYAAGAGQDFLSTGAIASFDTVSDEAFASGEVSIDDYNIVYLMLGEERETLPGHSPKPAFRVFPSGLRTALRRLRSRGIPVLISGSHVTEELQSPQGQAFGEELLGAEFRAERASQTGVVVGSAPPFGALRLHFNTRRGGLVYAAESPEALVPANPAAETVLRYADSNMSAAVGIPGQILTLGFPLETIEDPGARTEFLRGVLRYLNH